MKKIVMVMLLPTTLVANAYAGTVSDSLRTTLYYRSGYSLLELSYMDNAAKLETLKQGIRSIGDNPNTVLQHIKILSAASPEGNSKLNKRLASMYRHAFPPLRFWSCRFLPSTTFPFLTIHSGVFRMM